METIDLQYDLVEKCKTGDREAQYRLYRKYSSGMFSICKRMLRNEMDAEDLLQSSFVDVFAKLDSFKYQSTIGAWIKRIVINNCINHLRKRKLELSPLDEQRDVVAEDSKIEDNSLKIDLVKKSILRLPDGYRVVLSLYLLEGYDHKEISQVLGISESTSKSQYSRAKSKLKELIKASSV